MSWGLKAECVKRPLRTFVTPENGSADFVKDLGLPAANDARQYFDPQLFKDILRKLIAESRHLQNNPKLGMIPEEERAAKVVTDALAPFTKERGGPLTIEMCEYEPTRPNVKISLLADRKANPNHETVSFVSGGA